MHVSSNSVVLVVETFTWMPILYENRLVGLLFIVVFINELKQLHSQFGMKFVINSLEMKIKKKLIRCKSYEKSHGKCNEIISDESFFF